LPIFCGVSPQAALRPPCVDFEPLQERHEAGLRQAGGLGPEALNELANRVVDLDEE
jgi:hypothetical protein